MVTVSLALIWSGQTIFHEELLPIITPRAIQVAALSSGRLFAFGGGYSGDDEVKLFKDYLAICFPLRGTPSHPLNRKSANSIRKNVTQKG